MSDPVRIPDRTFNALIDERLSPRVEREIRHALESDPQGNERAVSWQRQSESLRAALDPVAQEPLPLSMMLKLRGNAASAWHRDRTLWLFVGTFAAGLAAGLALSALLPTLRPWIGF